VACPDQGSGMSSSGAGVSSCGGAAGPAGKSGASGMLSLWVPAGAGNSWSYRLPEGESR
jgi:hypothetical protein